MYSKELPSFAEASVEDLIRGGHQGASGDWHCLHCGRVFEAGLVYPLGEGYALAERALDNHVTEVHGGAFQALLGLGRDRTGLTEVQERLLVLLKEGRGDREMAADLGGKSESTVRNHRFNLRRKAAEAKVFLALMALVEATSARPAGEALVDYPEGLPVRDERTLVTEAEAAAIEDRCLADAAAGDFRIVFWPKKQKEKLVVLRRLAGLFEAGTTYSEAAVNGLLSPLYHDHVTIRRYLIEYRFLERHPDGSAYWRA